MGDEPDIGVMLAELAAFRTDESAASLTITASPTYARVRVGMMSENHRVSGFVVSESGRNITTAIRRAWRKMREIQ